MKREGNPMLLKTANPTREDELSTPPKAPLGYIDWDCPTSCNERVIMRASIHNRERIVRDQYVRIDDPMGSRTGFLGRIVAGPFFSPKGARTPGSGFSLGMGMSAEISLFAEIELLGELVDGQPRESKTRPASRAAVHELTAAEVAELLGLSGDMVLGAISG